MLVANSVQQLWLQFGKIALLTAHKIYSQAHLKPMRFCMLMCVVKLTEWAITTNPACFCVAIDGNTKAFRNKVFWRHGSLMSAFLHELKCIMQQNCQYAKLCNIFSKYAKLCNLCNLNFQKLHFWNPLCMWDKLNWKARGQFYEMQFNAIYAKCFLWWLGKSLEQIHKTVFIPVFYK